MKQQFGGSKCSIVDAGMPSIEAIYCHFWFVLFMGWVSKFVLYSNYGCEILGVVDWCP